MSQVQTQAISFGKKITQKAESRAQRVEPRAVKNLLPRAVLGPDQEAGNVCQAGCQNCYGPVIAACLAFPCFLNRSMYFMILAGFHHGMYIGWVC